MVMVLVVAEARVLPSAAVLLQALQGAAAAALVILQAADEVAAAVTAEVISRAAAQRPKRASRVKWEQFTSLTRRLTQRICRYVR